MQKAAGKNQNRIARALLIYPSDLANTVSIQLILKERFPGTALFIAKEQTFSNVVRQHVHENYALEAGTIYLIDPMGNVIMTYEPKSKPMGIFKDLQRLLKASQVG